MIRIDRDERFCTRGDPIKVVQSTRNFRAPLQDPSANGLLFCVCLHVPLHLHFTTFRARARR